MDKLVDKSVDNPDTDISEEFGQDVEGPNEGIAVELFVKCDADARPGLAPFISEGESVLFQRIKFANCATGFIEAGIIYP